LQLEAAFVIGVGQNEENILYDACEICLEEAIANVWIGASKVVDNL